MSDDIGIIILEDGATATLEGGPQAALTSVPHMVSGKKLVSGVKDLLERLSGLGEVAKAPDGFHVDSVTLKLGVSADGGVNLIGIGKASIGVEAGISVTLKPNPHD